MQNILLIDDDEKLGELLKTFFSSFNLHCDNALHPEEGLKLLQQKSYQLVILDVMLPDQDGFSVCRTIRQESDIPIIMLTARGDVTDRIVGLELGADDYLPKPFEPRELLARIQSILKRSKNEPKNSKVLTFPGLQINTDSMEVFVQDKAVQLSGMEYQLLELLALSPKTIFSRDDILNQLKGIDADVFSRSVDILISRLRNKMKPLDIIKTVRSRGYIFAGKQEH